MALQPQKGGFTYKNSKRINIRSKSSIRPSLRNNNISVKNNHVMGGKKTKKNRKQKGGFTYKNSKRINIKSKSSVHSSSSSRKSRRRRNSR